MAEELGETREEEIVTGNQLDGPRPWRSLFDFATTSHIAIIIPALSLSALAGLLRPALASLLGQTFDAFSDFGAGNLNGDALKAKISTLSFSILALAGANWILKTLFFMLWLVFGELQAKEARCQLFPNLLNKDIEWFDLQADGVGALLPRFQTQIRDLQTATSQTLGFAIEDLAILNAATGLAVWTSWKITLATLATAPVAAALLSLTSARLQPWIACQEDELKKASKSAVNAIRSIDTVKAFNGQIFESQKYQSEIARAARAYITQAWICAWEIGIVRFFSLCMFVQGFWYGSYLVSSGQATAGNVLTCFWACLLAMKAAEDVMPMGIFLEKGRAAGANLRGTILKGQSKGGNRMGTIEDPKIFEGDIELRNVSFAYPSQPNKLVLSDLKFSLPAGRTTFIVGESGSGKSTIGNLINKIYEPNSGEILLNGHNLTSLRGEWIRSHITLVQPGTQLFNETILTNIAIGQYQVSRCDLDQAIEFSLLQETIRTLPEGLQTKFDVTGTGLSGGQKQRIAIARARLRNTPILILDEVTSALDYISATKIMQRIRKWRIGKTTIIVTHDTSLILDQDNVVLLGNGRMKRDRYGRNTSRRRDAGGAYQNAKAQDPLKITTLFHDRPARFCSRTSDTTNRADPSSPSGGIMCSESSSSLTPRSAMPEDLVTYHSTWDQQSPQSPQTFPFSGDHESDIVLRRLDNPKGMHFTHPGEASKRHTLRELLTPNLWKRFRSRFGGYSKIPGGEYHYELSMNRILLSIWQSLRGTKQAVLVLGFMCAFAHAVSLPLFAWMFSQLLSTFYEVQDTSGGATTWSVVILGLAIGDGAAESFMHYLLEVAGQNWIDYMRRKALSRILDQPKAWFERPQNSVSALTSCLDRNAEEMRNLIGRFAAFVFVALCMMLTAIIWSFLTCWKLTAVGLCCSPAWYGLTKSFQIVSEKWEHRTNTANDTVAAVFTEAFTDIKSVRALTLEKHFCDKFDQANSDALSVGFRRAIYTGVFFGASNSGVFVVTGE
ncbi:MAG: hypothetical protein Q9227_000644 [Pyrenula ochraceoflavens]